MDTTDTERPQPRNHASPSAASKICPGPSPYFGGPSDTRRTELNTLFTSKIKVVRWPTNPGPYAAVLVLLISLSLTGCKLIGWTDATQEKPASPSGTTAPRSVTPAPAPASPPQSPSRPAPPGQPTQLAEAKRPSAATSSKGAEKLVAPTAPALPRSEETVSHSTESKAVVARGQQAVSLPSGGVKELIVKGPRRVLRPERARPATRLWLGLALVALLVGFGASVLLKRQRKLSKASKSGKEELVLPKEFLVKEPAPLPRETYDF
jgi:hypothetical protein